MNLPVGYKNNMPSKSGVDLTSMRIGYVPCSIDLMHPADRRRFCYYAKKRNIKYEVANPDEKYDVVIVTENADISVWNQYKHGSTIIIYDLIDSYLAIPYTSIKGLLRGVAKFLVGQSKYLKINHWNAIRSMCKRSNAVICSTESQKSDILNFNNNVHIILDAQDEDIKMRKNDYRCDSTFNLIWEGLPQNVEQLTVISDALKVLSKELDIRLHVITDSVYSKYMGKYINKDTLRVVNKYFDNICLHDWNINTLSSIVTACDLAIIPINLNDPFVTGKPINKLLLFWRMAMPTIVSATPEYDAVMKQAGLKMSCESREEWIELLKAYINDEDKRKYAGETGFRIANNNFNENILLENWDSLFQSLLK